jgi:arylsulfatase
MAGNGLTRRQFGVAAAATAAVAGSATAQQKAGVPGSPGATITPDGKYLPNPPQKFRGDINTNAAQSKAAWPELVVPPKAAALATPAEHSGPADQG